VTATDAFAWARDRRLLRIFSVLREKGEARLVGGCVRDSLLGENPLENDEIDIDIATTLTPGEMKQAFSEAGVRLVATGEEHGTMTAVHDGLVAECTTLRADLETDGRHAEVRFTRDWDEDWRRRDFTINALYADETGSVWDPAGGLPDLKARRVRFIGEAETRIEEDALRILRFFRFSARFADSLDETGLAAIRSRVGDLGILSKERIWSELSRIFRAPRAPEALTAAEECGALAAVVDRPARPRIFAAVHAEGLHDPASGVAALWSALDAKALRAAFKPPGELIAGVEAIGKAKDRIRIGEGAAGLLYHEGRPAALAAAVILEAEGFDVPPGLTGSLKEQQVPVLPIGGRDLAERGVAPGPQMGRTLRAFEKRWLQQGAPSDDGLVERLLLEALGSEASR
jgi:poly(A) polymerase